MRRTVRGVVLGTAIALGVGSAVGASPASAAADGSRYGSFTAADGYLPAANTCGTYTYSFDLAPPPGRWLVEMTVTDPRGNAVASYGVLDGYSAEGKDGATGFTLCRNNTAPGVFTIAGKMTTDDGKGNVTTYQMTPGSFTLADLPKAAKSAKAKKAAKKAAKKRAAKKRAQEQRRDRGRS